MLKNYEFKTEEFLSKHPIKQLITLGHKYKTGDKHCMVRTVA
jgi:hypothetical protein